MSDHPYNFDDEVWVRGWISPTNSVTFRRITTNNEIQGWHNIVPLKEDIRIADDFRDPLDEAIVEAAIEWQNTGNAGSLFCTVQAKLDANNPKTVHQIHLDHYDLDANGQCACGTVVAPLGYHRPTAHAAHIADKIREAGLLKDNS